MSGDLATRFFLQSLPCLVIIDRFLQCYKLLRARLFQALPTPPSSSAIADAARPYNTALKRRSSTSDAAVGRQQIIIKQKRKCRVTVKYTRIKTVQVGSEDIIVLQLVIRTTNYQEISDYYNNYNGKDLPLIGF